MILEKIMMIQNASPVDSVDYLISKKTIELKNNIKSYTLNRFIDEIGVSRTSMVRYLKNINIHKFTYYKNIMHDEYMHIDVIMRLSKQDEQLNLTKKEKELCKKIGSCQRILILGDGNRFSLLPFQQAMTYLGHSCEIPVYLGSEETVIEEHNLTEKDLVIIINLQETYIQFCTNRSMFYKDAKYLEIQTNAKVGYIGMLDAHPNENMYFEYGIQNSEWNQLQKTLMNITKYLIKQSSYY